MYYRKKSNNF